MHLNYYFLRQWVGELSCRWVGWKLGECFSQSKDELILGFYRPGESWYLKVLMRGDFSGMAVQEEYHRSKRNSVDLFREFVDQEISEVEMYANERSFAIHFAHGESMVFKMHGNRSNLLHFRDGKVVTLFKNKLKPDADLLIQDFSRELEVSSADWLAAEGHIPSLFPTFGKEVLGFWEQEGNLNSSLEEQWTAIQGLRELLENPGTYYLVEWKGKPALTLFPLGEVKDTYSSPVEAMNGFFFAFTRTYFLKQEKAEATSRLRARLRRCYNYLAKTRKKLNELQEGTAHQQIGDLLMANLHLIEPMSTQVVLDNFYTQQPITVKLKKDLSPQKNAEVYYRKAKNQRLEIAQLEKNLHAKEEEVFRLEEHQEAIVAMEAVRPLRVYLKENKLQQDHDGGGEKGPFRRYTYMGYDIWVGKSAKNNDELTQRFATKDDLWLHAKDVSGSHVVIKNKPGQNYPEMVIERAAELAAYYSKRKSDTLCPVIYTPKKYVRKVKGAPAGAVVVDREEVIMVEPAKTE